MPFPEQARKNLAVTPPRAFVSGGGGQGQIATLATSAVAIAVDLTKTFNRTLNGTVQGGKPLTETRNALTIFADTADVGIIFGSSVAAVSGANAPVLATTGTLSTNTYTGAAGTCYRIPAGQERRYILANGVDNAVGIVGSAAGTVRLFQSSPDDA